MQISVDIKGVNELLKKIDAKKVMRGIQFALNRAAGSGKTEISSQIREKWSIKKSDLDKKISLKPAVSSNFRATISLTGEPINLLYFPTRQIAGSSAISIKRKGRISPEAQIKKGKGRGYSGVTSQIEQKHKTVLPKAFIARARKGGIPLVLIRSSKAKSKTGRKEGLLAIKVITETSMFRQPKVIAAVEKKIKTQFSKEWENMFKQLKEGRL